MCEVCALDRVGMKRDQGMRRYWGMMGYPALGSETRRISGLARTVSRQAMQAEVV